MVMRAHVCTPVYVRWRTLLGRATEERRCRGHRNAARDVSFNLVGSHHNVGALGECVGGTRHIVSWNNMLIYGKRALCFAIERPDKIARDILEVSTRGGET